MKQISKFLAVALLVLATISCKKEPKAEEQIIVPGPDTTTVAQYNRIISLNGAMTEIVAALGQQDKIVGVDVTSTYPDGIKDSATDLGHIRSISIEGIMALQPDLILAAADEISPELEEKIKLAKVEIKVFNREFSADGAKALIGQVATVLQAEGALELQDKIDVGLNKVVPLPLTQKVLFIYARGGNNLMVGGVNTPVEKVIQLAGGQNAVSDFDNYKPLTPEALIQSNPDVILMFTSGMESIGGIEGVLKIPGIDKTNAGKNKKIIAMDGALLAGFGPRVGKAAAELNRKLAENAK